jgi:hypothetical protein
MVIDARGKPVVRRHDGRGTPGGKTFADQQPDKVVGNTPMGVSIPLEKHLIHGLLAMITTR